jgi:hypothetical protein
MLFLSDEYETRSSRLLPYSRNILGKSCNFQSFCYSCCIVFANSFPFGIKTITTMTVEEKEKEDILTQEIESWNKGFEYALRGEEKYLVVV